ncbi:LLM class F420-dependent oxidoreductase [Chloroflexia bacterium SDU3-3]|nr:LLM class F420-dependent oxidoreductase [Chloroflexia bacterium SDU3-3]
MAVQFGVFVPQGWRMDLVEIADPIEKYEAMTAVAKAADELPAFDSIWLYDHFHTVPQPTQEAVFECWASTAALARDTKRVNIGQMVTCNGYRNPAVLAKMASTIDVLSHGRLYCGLGAGWYEHEWRAYGYGFPETRERMRGFREAVKLIVKMWTEDTPKFDGEYYHINGPINEPKGVRKPHPSLWLGGGGEKVTLKLVARYANACNVGGGDPETIRQKLAILQQHCADVGRNYDEIIKSTSMNILLLEDGADREKATEPYRKLYGWSQEELEKQAVVGNAEQVAARVQAVVDAGANYVITYFPRVAYDRTGMVRFAQEIAPTFQ